MTQTAPCFLVRRLFMRRFSGGVWTIRIGRHAVATREDPSTTPNGDLDLHSFSSFAALNYFLVARSHKNRSSWTLKQAARR